MANTNNKNLGSNITIKGGYASVASSQACPHGETGYCKRCARIPDRLMEHFYNDSGGFEELCPHNKPASYPCRACGRQ